MVVHRVGRIYLHVQRNGTNSWIFAWSADGLGWHTIGTTQTQLFTTLNRLRMYGVGVAGATGPGIRDFGIDWVRVNHIFL
jgi:hypothetical protein